MHRRFSHAGLPGRFRFTLVESKDSHTVHASEPSEALWRSHFLRVAEAVMNQMIVIQFISSGTYRQNVYWT